MSAGSDKLRVLLIAEGCNPKITSVALEGYNYAKALASLTDLELTIVTHIRCKWGLDNDPIHTSAQVEYIDNEFIARPCKQFSDRVRKGSWGIETAMQLAPYIVFEHMVHRQYGDRLRRGDFDLIHRLNPLTPTFGSPLATLTHTPMILGPLNGGIAWPRDHPGIRRLENEWLSRFRHYYRWLPYYRRTYQIISGVIYGSHYTRSEAPKYCNAPKWYHPENGVDPQRFPLAESWREPQGKFRFITVGRLVPYKGMDLILEAMHGSDILKSARLTIAGEGFFGEHLQSLCHRLGLEEQVDFAGNLDQNELSRELNQSQAFVFPSLREFGGAVVVEAMASGLPAIVVDYGGPGEHVTPETGIALPMAPREKIIKDLRSAMERLMGDHDLCRRFSAAAVLRVRDKYTWTAKAAELVEFYREAIVYAQGQPWFRSKRLRRSDVEIPRESGATLAT